MDVPEQQQDADAPEQQAPQEDPIKNLKSEFARKQANLEAQQAETNAQLQAILAEMQKSTRTPEAPKKSARELVFDDPEEFVRTVKQDAVREATETVSKQFQASQAVQTEVNSFIQKFPEFGQEGSEAAIVATRIASKLPAKLKGTVEGARVAMSEAALELGLIAANKRKTTVSEEPVAGRGGGNSGPAPKPKGSIDPKTRAFAEALGLDFNDPKQVAALEKANSRKNYGSYE